MHFIFNEKSNTDLHQGDLLTRTPDLIAVLEQFHPYYRQKSDYSHFLVLTQTCDLVRRNGKNCDTQYITLCAVRPLNIVLQREAHVYRHLRLLKAANALGTKNREKLSSFLKKLLNNNHPEYFYLDEEPGIGLTDRSCAFLRLSVSLRSEDHYDAIIKARIASLNSQFQAKLGWLVGNIYSRVGTDDWVPDHLTESSFQQLVNQILDQSLLWVDEEKVKAADRTITDQQLAILSQSDLLDMIRKTQIKARKEQAVNAILEILTKDQLIDGNKANTIRNRLTSDPVLAGILK